MEVDPLKRIAKLRREIERHNKLYYNEARPEISDQKYDELLRELEELERQHPEIASAKSPTQAVGARSKHARVTHRIPMLSLDNTYTPEELLAFDERIRGVIAKPVYAVEPKIDGVAVSLIYEDGKLVSATTRGDGVIGEDVTANIRTIDELPQSVKKLHGEWNLRGEVYISRKRFAEIVSEMTEAGETPFANPRNTAAGTLKLLDPGEVARRKLHVAIHSIAGRREDHLEAMDRLESAGLPVIAPRKSYTEMSRLVDDLGEFDQSKGRHAFETDGLVIKVDSSAHREELGQRSRSPRWAIAYKFQPEIGESTLNAIELQVGRTGVVTPVAKFDPVWISGTTVSSATLHNEDEIRRLDLRVGDRIRIQKAGEIIPQIIESIPAKKRGAAFAMPGRCPVCSAKVIRPEGQVKYRCVSPACPATCRGRIIHFGSRAAMKIDGLGPRIIDSLVDAGHISDAGDLYDLDLEKLMSVPRFAEKSAQNLLDAINDSRKRPLDRIIFALGIPGVGESTARDLARAFGSLAHLAAAEIADLIEVPEIGETLANSIVLFFRDPATVALLKKLGRSIQPETKSKAVVASPFTGKRIVITGRIEGIDRNEAEEKLRELGAIVQSSVSKTTDLLIAGESAGSKFEKATKLGTTILSAEDFVEALNKMK